jgi:hypothetical protein
LFSITLGLEGLSQWSMYRVFNVHQAPIPIEHLLIPLIRTPPLPSLRKYPIYSDHQRGTHQTSEGRDRRMMLFSSMLVYLAVSNCSCHTMASILQLARWQAISLPFSTYTIRPCLSNGMGIVEMRPQVGLVLKSIVVA